MSRGDLDEGNLVLSDLVNRVLDVGVVISGHVLISIADIDLIALDLKLLITSIETAARVIPGADVIPSEARDPLSRKADPSQRPG